MPQVELLVTDRQTNIIESAEIFYGVPIKFTIERLKIPDIAGNIENFPRFLWSFLYTIQRIIFAIKASSHIRKHKPDIIYARDHWITAMVAIFNKRKVVWESHEAKYNLPARYLVNKLDKTVVISEGIRNFYIKKGIPENKILVAHDGIDDSFFESHISKQEARKRLDIDTNLPVVMYIGGLDQWKGVDTLFESAEANSNKYEVYVVGGTEQAIESYKNKFPAVHFLGQRPYKELRYNQQAADVLVIPNTAKNKLASEYTSPLKLFAHMTSKVPLVVSDIPSLRNVLGEGAACYFKPDNPSSLSMSINKVISDIDFGHSIAQSAYSLSKQYKWRQRADSLTVSLTQD